MSLLGIVNLVHSHLKIYFDSAECSNMCIVTAQIRVSIDRGELLSRPGDEDQSGFSNNDDAPEEDEEDVSDSRCF